MSNIDQNDLDEGVYIAPDLDRKYTKCYNDILYHKEMSFNSKLILTYYLSHKSTYVVHQKQVCKDLKIGKSVVSKSIKELTVLGYVKRFKVKRNNLFNGWRTIVSSIPCFKENQDIEIDETVGNPQLLPKSDFQTSVNQTSSDNQSIEIDETVGNPQLLPKSDFRTSKKESLTKLSYNKTNLLNNKKNKQKSLESDFDRFWDIYPRRIAKSAAKKAFIKAAKDVDVEEIIDGARRYASYALNHNVEDKYQPHPASWLNKGQWEDEISTTRTILGKNKNVDNYLSAGQRKHLEANAAAEHGYKEAIIARNKRRAEYEAKALEDGRGDLSISYSD